MFLGFLCRSCHDIVIIPVLTGDGFQTHLKPKSKNKSLSSGGPKWPPLPLVGQTGHHQRAARVSMTFCLSWPVRGGAESCCPATVTLCCVRQVPEGPGMVGDRRPLPAEALPGSPVPPGDGSRNALDRPQPYCVLSQQSKRASFSF